MDHKHNRHCKTCRKPMPAGSSFIWCDDCSSRTSPYITRLNHVRQTEMVCPGCAGSVVIGHGEIVHRDYCRIVLADQRGETFSRVILESGVLNPMIEIRIVESGNVFRAGG